MDRVEKLFRRLKARDRERLERIIEKLLAGDKAGLDIKKISGSDTFRVRSGDFRSSSTKSQVRSSSMTSLSETSGPTRTSNAPSPGRFDLRERTGCG